jgi:hypothetical protein
MKKLLLLMLSFFMALGAGLANASSRSDAMSADINVVEDYDLIFTYPNKVIDYKNTVDFRMQNPGAGTANDWAGILDGKFEKIGVIGVYMSRYTMVAPGSYQAAATDNQVWISNNFATAHPVTVLTPKPVVDLFWGKTFDKLNIGVQLSYADSKSNTTTTTAAYTDVVAVPATSEQTIDYARQLGLRVGVGMKDLGPFQEANFAAGYAVKKFEVSDISSPNPGGNGSLTDDGAYTLDLNADLRHDLGENDNLKVFASFVSDAFGLKGFQQSTPQNNTGTLKTTNMDLGLGVGVNHSVAEGAGLVAGGVKAEMATRKDTGDTINNNGVDYLGAAKAAFTNDLQEEKTTTLSLPVFISVEAKVKSWLTLRAGAKYFLYDNSHVTDTYTLATDEIYSSVANTFSFSTGFGMNWKNWVLDGVLSTDQLENSINRVRPGAGVFFNGTMATVAKADLKYKF